jgi:hypothetical protein
LERDRARVGEQVVAVERVAQQRGAVTPPEGPPLGDQPLRAVALRMTAQLASDPLRRLSVMATVAAGEHAHGRIYT